ncbi:hypothetical protein [Pseudomonas sp. AU12215]|uniref:hypothetical protein n=1 Tax=Pseudomonas sp. AU12215 TaxID=1860123 RepID=UPI0011465E10|nr:hypothetical protein [Pseudomonas sp. AU12215]
MGNYSIEIDFPDLILLMGAPTASLYILQFISSFKTRNKSMKLFAMLSLGSILIISNTAGHIFVSALVLPYISAVAEAECNTVTGLKQVHHAATPLPLS